MPSRRVPPAIALALAALVGCGAPPDEDLCRARLGALCDPGPSRGGPIDDDDLLAVDLDGDGILEIVVASRLGDALTISREGADPRTIALAGAPSALAAADLDGDGLPEVAVALADRDEVVILGDLLGAATILDTLAVGESPRDLWLGDLDLDGALDLVTADVDGGTVTVFRGADRRTTRVDAGVAPVAVDVGDLDGDGLLDLAVVDFEGGALRPLHARGDGDFAAAKAIPISPGIEALDLVDLDGDGDLDALVRGRAAAKVWRCDGRGSAGLGPAESLALTGVSADGRGVIGLAPADGAPGGVIASGDAGLQTWLVEPGARVGRVATDLGYAGFDRILEGAVGRGVGPLIATRPGRVAVGERRSPSFVERWRLDFLTGAEPGPTVPLDLDGDGLVDLAVARGNWVLLLRGLGGDAFEIAATHTLFEHPTALLVGDVTGDGVDDIVAGFGAPRLQVLHGQGDGVFQLREPEFLWSGGDSWHLVRSQSVPWIIGVGGYDPFDPRRSIINITITPEGQLWGAGEIGNYYDFVKLHVGDLDGDGNEDELVRYGVPAINIEIHNDTIGRRDLWGNQFAWYAGLDPEERGRYDSAVGDLDDDGKAELLLVGPGGVRRIDALNIIGTTPVLTSIGDEGPYLEGQELTVVDVDGDGRRDLMAAAPDGLAFALQRDDGTFGPPSRWPIDAPKIPDVIAADEGPWIDVVVQTSGALSLRPGSEWAAPVFDDPRWLPGRPQAIVSGDFNGDDRRDLAILREGALSLHLGPGAHEARDFAESVAHPIAGGGAVLGRFDLDGDGVDELLTVGLEVVVRRLVGDHLEVVRAYSGLPPDAEVQGVRARDLDGDGDEDLVFALLTAPKRLDLAIVRNHGGSLPRADHLVLNLEVDDGPRLDLGDLDGDGLVEIAVSGGVEGSGRVVWAEPRGRYRVEETRGRDLVILEDEGSLITLEGDRVRRRLGRGGHLGEAVTIHAHPRLQTAILRLAADLDGDGRTDLALGDAGLRGPTIRLADAGTFPEVLRIPGTHDLPELVDDLDGDGRPDLVLRRLGHDRRPLGFELRLSGGAP
ncbi:MAG: VCBS repeat-containing protein [Nannocystaceae bacterium]